MPLAIQMALFFYLNLCGSTNPVIYVRKDLTTCRLESCRWMSFYLKIPDLNWLAIFLTLKISFYLFDAQIPTLNMFNNFVIRSLTTRAILTSAEGFVLEGESVPICIVVVSVIVSWENDWRSPLSFSTVSLQYIHSHDKGTVVMLSEIPATFVPRGRAISCEVILRCGVIKFSSCVSVTTYLAILNVICI